MISIKFQLLFLSGAVQMAPTAKLQKHKHELELAKMKIACQEDLIKELTKERDFLKDQLSQSKSVVFTNILSIMIIYFVAQIMVLYLFFIHVNELMN